MFRFSNISIERRSANDTLIRIAVGALLTLAATLKIVLPEHQSPTGHGLLGSAVVQIMAAAFELVLGGWILAVGFRPVWTRALTAGCFLLFAALAAYKAVAGHASCGCFGAVAVNPIYTLAADGCALFAIVGYPSFCRDPIAPGRLRSALLGGAALAGLALIVVPIYSHFAPSRFPGAIVVVEPEKWVGERLPLLSYIDIADELERGNWLVVLHRHDCDTCRATLARYESPTSNETARGNDRGRRVAFIELPPYGQLQGNVQRTALRGRLSTSKQWFVTPPVFISIRDGIVAAAARRTEHNL